MRVLVRLASVRLFPCACFRVRARLGCAARHAPPLARTRRPKPCVRAQVHLLIDEMVMGGMVLRTNTEEILEAMAANEAAEAAGPLSFGFGSDAPAGPSVAPEKLATAAEAAREVAREAASLASEKLVQGFSQGVRMARELAMQQLRRGSMEDSRRPSWT